MFKFNFSLRLLNTSYPQVQPSMYNPNHPFPTVVTEKALLDPEVRTTLSPVSHDPPMEPIPVGG
jgi:hypothetical protein